MQDFAVARQRRAKCLRARVPYLPDTDLWPGEGV